MKKILILLLTVPISLLSCKDKKADDKTVKEETTVAAASTTKDSADIRTVIIGFYDWYDMNYARLMKFDLYSGIKKEGEPPYKMNWSEVEKYQNFIRDSVPQLGDEFLKNQKHFFEQCDSAFKKDVADDIPYGFDYDWYTNSQEETKYTTDQVRGKTPWLVQVNGDDAIVKILASFEEKDVLLTINMKKENGTWKIAKIS